MDLPLSNPKRPRGDALARLAPDRHLVVLDDAPARAPYPFSSQSGNQLLLLDLEADGWVFAELAFDPAACGYAEVRRATYAWSREAIGALLSRSLSVSESALIDTVERLDLYMRRHYGLDVINA